MQHVQKLNVEHVVVDAWIQKRSKKSAEEVVGMPERNLPSVYIATSTSR
jgi:hypothetical protein